VDSTITFMSMATIPLPIYSLSQVFSYSFCSVYSSEWFYSRASGYYDQCLMDLAWTKVKGNDNMIGCAEVISVSTSYSRC